MFNEEMVIYSGWTLLSIAALVINFLLLRAIYLNRAKRHLTIFSVFLVEGIVANFSVVSLGWMLLPRPETASPIASYRVIGVARFLGESICFVLYSLFNHFSCLQPTTILISFILRFVCISRPITLSLSTFMAIVAYLPAIFYLTLLLSCKMEEISVVNGNETLEGVTIYLRSNIWQYATVSAILIGISMVSFVFCFVLRVLILRSMGKYTSTDMSENTRNIHKALTLTIQSIITAVPLLAVTFFLLRSQVQQSLFFSSIRYIALTSVAFFDATVPLFYVKLYRETIFRKKKYRDTSASFNNNISQKGFSVRF